MKRRRDDGQATVELALCLPLVVMLVLGVLQVALTTRAQLAVEVAARESARAAAVSADPAGAARRAAEAVTSLRPLAVDVTVTARYVTVTVRHVDPTDVALVGRLVPAATLEASVTMALEPP
jgi:Flp pilus assembly protein TadG